MGRAAENERLKLRATFFNNIAVGIVVAGLVIPYLAIYPQLDDFTDWVTAWVRTGQANFSGKVVHWMVALIGSSVAAGLLAWLIRLRADAEAAEIED
jgi:hypothetical protein